MSYLKQAKTPPQSTLRSIAGSLKDYLIWLEETETCFLTIDMRRHSRPTYRYCRFLRSEIQKGVIQLSTARKKLGCVINMYRWLGQFNLVDCDKLWISSNAYISFDNSSWHSAGRKITTTDLSMSLSRAKQRITHDKYIIDNGRLRPLSRREIIVLRECLHETRNVEMCLAFDIALVTGARLESVFTLRVGSFTKALEPSSLHKKILIGGNSLVKAKDDRNNFLFFPASLYSRIRSYLNSQRALDRKRKSAHTYAEQGEEYLFLTRTGKAYYLDENDSNAILYGLPPTGNSITQFIRNTLKPALQSKGEDFNLTFHDLRATFGLSLVDFEVSRRDLQSPLLETSPDYLRVLNYVKERMGHSSTKTTMGYLSYRNRNAVVRSINNEFEEFLFGSGGKG